MKIKDNTMKLLLIIIGLTVIITGIAYAFTDHISEGSNNNFSSGKINFVYTESTNSISLDGYDSLADADGKVLNDYFSFNVKASTKGKTKIGYYIYFTEDAENTLNKDAVKFYLTKVNAETDAIENEIELSNPIIASEAQSINKHTLKEDESAGEYLIYSDEFDLNDNEMTHYYRLRMWVNSDYSFNDSLEYSDIENGTKVTLDKQIFKAKINVVAYDGEKLTLN